MQPSPVVRLIQPCCSVRPEACLARWDEVSEREKLE